jgi:hypothetical protein
MLVAAAAEEAARGWDNTWGLLAGGAVIYAIWRVDLHLRSRTEIENPSPTPALPTAERVKVKATVGFTDPEPDEPEVGWWGRIVEVGGVRYRQARQIAATGSHVLPEPEVQPEPPEDDIDLALDDEPEATEEVDEPIEAYINRALDLGIPYNQMVKVLMDHYAISKSTAKRRIGEVRSSRQRAEEAR